jgi:hypothetical protein
MWFFATVNRIFEIICVLWGEPQGKVPSSMTQSRIILYTIQTVIMSSRGLIYALIYCRYNKINEQISKFAGMLCCRKQTVEIDEVKNSLM